MVAAVRRLAIDSRTYLHNLAMSVNDPRQIGLLLPLASVASLAVMARLRDILVGPLGDQTQFEAQLMHGSDALRTNARDVVSLAMSLHNSSLPAVNAAYCLLQRNPATLLVRTPVGTKAISLQAIESMLLWLHTQDNSIFEATNPMEDQATLHSLYQEWSQASN